MGIITVKISYKPDGNDNTGLYVPARPPPPPVNFWPDFAQFL
jgi:hypothetical protein